MLPFIPRDPKRLLTYCITAVFAALCCLLTIALKPRISTAEVLTLGMGYASLVLLAMSLVIGPLNLFRQRRNPVNIMLRRDIGIGTGVTGVAHIVFGFQVHMGGDVVQYFFERRNGVLFPQLNLFGASNFIGLIAGVILVILLVISNDLSLRLLKGKRWKTIQRFNYLLVVLVIAHTFGYQSVTSREQILVAATISISIVILLFQMVGFRIMHQRRMRRIPA